MVGGGRFDFDDGGTYCGGWEDGKAHGHGVCTGPKGQGEYSGAWSTGFEASGVYTWPSGNAYEGQWMQGKRHGVGMENKGHWIYHGEWTQGFKGRYGVRASNSSGAKYEGTWTTGLQDGYGVETYADGVNRLSSLDRNSTLDRNTLNVQGVAPHGTYQGQWLRGMRHGYGVRQSVPYGLASHYRPKGLRNSLTSLRSEADDNNAVKDRDRKVDENRGGFVLQATSENDDILGPNGKGKKGGRSSLRKSLLSGLKLRKQKSTGDIQDSPRRPTGSVRSTVSQYSNNSTDSHQSAVTSASMCTESNLSFVSQDDITDINVTETYMGEWKNDKRSGFGISERTDGLKYEGEWYNNTKYGYGVTTFKDGTKEDGKYKNNVLISSGKKAKLFLIRTSKLRERVDNAVAAAQRAAQIAHQKADIAISRMANARSKAEQAEQAATTARKDSEVARKKALEFAPEFQQPAMELSPNQKPPEPQRIAVNEPEEMIQTTNTAMAASRPPPGDRHRTSRQDQPREPPPRGRGMNGEPPGYRDADPHHKPHPTQENEISANNVRTSNLPPPHGAPHREEERDRGRPPPAERLSNLLDPISVNDHFDQYGTMPRTRNASNRPGRDSENHRRSPVESRRSYDQGPIEPVRSISVEAPRQTINNRHNEPPMAMNHVDSRPPPSGVTLPADPRDSKPMVRRKTLPSIMKGTPTQPLPPTVPLPYDPSEMPEPPSKPKPPRSSTVDDTALLKKGAEPERYVIVDGVRKRVKAEVYRRPSKPADPIRPPTQLPSRYKMEAGNMSSSSGKRGSLPDVASIGGNPLMPREEVHKLSEKRRAELRRLEEEADRRRQQEIVLRLADFKDWCQQRQLMMLVIALNVSLATMFFNLLSQ